MGAGNVCVHNRYEGLYYVDNDYLDMYRKTDSDGAYRTRLQNE